MQFLSSNDLPPTGAILRLSGLREIDLVFHSGYWKSITALHIILSLFRKCAREIRSVNHLCLFMRNPMHLSVMGSIVPQRQSETTSVGFSEGSSKPVDASLFRWCDLIVTWECGFSHWGAVRTGSSFQLTHTDVCV